MQLALSTERAWAKNAASETPLNQSQFDRIVSLTDAYTVKRIGAALREMGYHTFNKIAPENVDKVLDRLERQMKED